MLFEGLEGFLGSIVQATENDAIEAVYNILTSKHQNVKVLNIRNLTSTGGLTKEVDGAIEADGSVALIAAKTKLDLSAVDQLASCIKFVR
jgi:hypothetical protein